MNMTDPIADMLTRIRNASMARHQTVLIPSSQVKVEIARILKDEGYIGEYDMPPDMEGRMFRVWLKYDNDKKPVLSGLKRVSKPGLRVYAKATNLPRVLGGLGVAIISTSGGLRTDKQCQKQGVGGEVLAYVW